jgi:hypothetical protein
MIPGIICFSDESPKRDFSLVVHVRRGDCGINSSFNEDDGVAHGERFSDRAAINKGKAEASACFSALPASPCAAEIERAERSSRSTPAFVDQRTRMATRCAARESARQARAVSPEVVELKHVHDFWLMTAFRAVNLESTQCCQTRSNAETARSSEHCVDLARYGGVLAMSTRHLDSPSSGMIKPRERSMSFCTAEDRAALKISILNIKV